MANTIYFLTLNEKFALRAGPSLQHNVYTPRPKLILPIVIPIAEARRAIRTTPFTEVVYNRSGTEGTVISKATYPLVFIDELYALAQLKSLQSYFDESTKYRKTAPVTVDVESISRFRK